MGLQFHVLIENPLEMRVLLNPWGNDRQANQVEDTQEETLEGSRCRIRAIT